MITIAGQELIYSTSVVLFANDVAVIAPQELMGSVIEIVVQKEPGESSGLQQSGLNEVKLVVEMTSGCCNATTAMISPQLGVLAVRIVTVTTMAMTTCNVQVTRE